MRRGDTSREWKFLEAEAGLDMLIAIWFVTSSGFSCLWKIPISSGPNQVVSRARVLLKKTCNMWKLHEEVHGNENNTQALLSSVPD